MAKLIFDQLRKAEGKPVQVQPMVEAIMDAKGLDKTHRDAVREISARVLAQSWAGKARENSADWPPCRS